MTKKIGYAVLAVLVIVPYYGFRWTLSSSLAGRATGFSVMRLDGPSGRGYNLMEPVENVSARAI